MARVYRTLMDVCWALGIVCMLVGVVFKFSPDLMRRFGTEPRGFLIFAGVLFLCAIATRAVGRTGVPPGQ